MSGQPKISILTSLYRSESYLPRYLDHIREQTIFAKCEFILVFNEASDEEKRLALAVHEEQPDRFQLVFVEPVETLGASWNRAWKYSQAPLIAVWNVDDRRTPDSLERQWQAMLAHPHWQLCYGDYVRVPDYGVETGQLRRTPKYSQGRFRRSFPQGGAFWLMRRAIAKEISYFDEQFQVGPDLDYSVRLAEAGYSMGRAEGLLGYFTDTETGLSTRDAGRASGIERTAIQLRYGIFDKVRPDHIAVARRYRLDAILAQGQWIVLERLLPGLAQGLERRKPLWTLGKLRNAMRTMLASLGLLDWLHRWQKRLIGREL